MNIVVVTQIFETLEDNGSDRLLFFAQNLVNNGHNVKIITGNFDYKAGKRRFDCRKKVIKKVSGIDVVYVPVYSNIRGNYFKRFLFYISFILSCFKELLISAKRADVIWAISTPLTVPFVCAIISRIKKIPLVSEITDVWPDAAVHSGVVKNRFIIGLAKKMEIFCYKSSVSIICLTKGIKLNILNKGIQSSKIHLITNGVNIDLFDNVSAIKMGNTRTSLGLEKKFIAMYLGAHGKYNSLDTIIDAANELRHDESIVFVLVGDGEQKIHLKNLVNNKNLNNVIFHAPVKRIDAPQLLSIADCFLLPNLAGEFFQGNLPNKVFDYLASSRPTIVAGRVESADLVEKIKAGFVVDAENHKKLANTIKMVSTMDEAEREDIGLRGGIYVRKNYDRNIHADIMSTILENASR